MKAAQPRYLIIHSLQGLQHLMSTLNHLEFSRENGSPRARHGVGQYTLVDT